MQFKKVLAIMLAGVLTVGALAGCGNTNTPSKTSESKETSSAQSSSENKEASSSENKEASTSASTQEKEAFDPKTVTEGVTLTIAVPDSATIEDFNTNVTTVRVEEALGVDLVFEPYASSTYSDKLNVMINGGDKLPDIIFSPSQTFTDATLLGWHDAGAIIPLNEYYENPDYAKNINEGSQKVGMDIASALKNINGDILGIPRYLGNPGNEFPTKMWVNKQYAAALGYEELPTTTEGLFELCKAFKEAGDINGNGLDDEVVFTTHKDDKLWFNFLMTPYVLAWDDYYLDVTDGKLEFAYATDAWKEGLKYIKRFFDEGILDTTILTNDRDAANAINRSDAFPILAEFYYHATRSGKDSVETFNTRLMYDYILGVAGPEGRIESRYVPLLPGNGAVITTDCKNPLAAFLVLDYYCREEVSIAYRYGAEGINWDYMDNLDETKLPEGLTKANIVPKSGDYDEAIFYCYDDATYFSSGTPQNTGYGQRGPCIVQNDLTMGFGLAVDPNKEGGDAERNFWSMYLAATDAGFAVRPSENITKFLTTAEENDKLGTIQPVLTSYVNESIGAFLTGQWDIDSYWDTYLSELKKIGIEDALKIYQTSYDRTLE